MDVIDRIEEYLGDDLTSDTASRYADAIPEDVVLLVEGILSHYRGWLDNQIQLDSPDTAGYYHCIDPFPADGDWRSHLNRHKQFLLYFPSLIVPDPLARLVMPFDVIGHIVDDSDFRHKLVNALTLLAVLKPLARNGDILLTPVEFCLDHELVQEPARQELRGLSGSNATSYFGPIIRAAASESDSKALESFLGNITTLPYGAIAELMWAGENFLKTAISDTQHVKVVGQLCANLQITPVAGNKVVRAALQQDYESAGQFNPAPAIADRVASTLMRYEVPGIRDAELEEIVALRKNDEVFEELRRNYGKVLDLAQRESPADQRQFEVELKQACDDLLKPRIDDLKKVTESSFGEKALIPGILALGAGFVVFLLTGQFPLTAKAGAGATPGNWVLDKLRKRFTKSGRKAVMLREAYGMLLPKED